jgi:hypothetical protein
MEFWLAYLRILHTLSIAISISNYTLQGWICKGQKCLRQQLKLWQALKISFYYNISVFQCFHIFHITYYHECNLECNGIFKNTEIKTCTLLEFIEAIDQSVSMDVKLSGCL